MILSDTGKYWNDSNVAVRSLVINGTPFAPGTYNYNSFTTAQRAFLFDNGGSITVTNAGPPPPTIGLVLNQSIRQGVAALVVFSVGGGVDSNTLMVSGVSSNPGLVPNGNLQFGGSGANRTVVITPLSGQSGTAVIQLIVSDGSASATATFTVTVTPAPRFVGAMTAGTLSDTATWSQPAPISGDTNIWRSNNLVLDMKNNAAQTFFGEFLVIGQGGQLIPGIAGPVLTMNHLILDGGSIVQVNNLPFRMLLGGKTLTLNGGILRAGSANNNRDLRFENGALAGNGTIQIQNAITTGTASGSDVEFTDTIITDGFTGIFDVSGNGLLSLPPIATASFGLTLSGSGKYWNDAPVALTSLTIAGNIFPPGTYTYANIGAAYQSFLGNNGGSITVIPSSPSYGEWAQSQNLTGSEMDDDDGDGLPNLLEYALGGNPRNPADRGRLPQVTFDPDGLNYTFVKRSGPALKLRYNVQISGNLEQADWSDFGTVVIGSRQLDPNFETITRRVPALPNSRRFVRLKIENP